MRFPMGVIAHSLIRWQCFWQMNHLSITQAIFRTFDMSRVSEGWHKQASKFGMDSESVLD